MSAIFGTFAPDHARLDSVLDTLRTALRAHGPDGGSVWRSPPVGLGHLLLKVTPEDAGEQMPLRDGATGVVITADARLDNREELCRQLSLPSGSFDPSLPDIRILLAAYLKWGTDFAAHLLGDFALALWDPRDRRLVCARDPMGVRPLYYSYERETLVFASDLRGLLAAHELEREPDELALRELIVFGDVPGTERTLWKDVWRLPPAHTLTASSDGLVVRRYWSFDDMEELRLEDEEAYREHFRELLDEAIRCRLRCSREVGAHLTGGLDSSSIAVLAARQLRSTGRELETFSWAPPPEGDEDGRDDERRYVAEVCEAASLTCHYTTVGVEDALAFRRRVPGIEPTETLQREHVVERKAAAMGIRLMLSGWGGDELVSFNGRGYFAELAASLRWRTLFRELHLKARLDREGWSWVAELVSLFTHRVAEPFLPGTLLALLRPDALATPVHDFVSDELASRMRNAAWLPREPGRELRSVRANQHSLLRRGHLQRRMEDWTASGGEHGLVYAYPLLDKRIVEFALRLPPRFFFRNGWKRYFFRWAMEGVLPDGARWNPTKREPSLARSAVSLRRTLRSKAEPSMSRERPGKHPYVNLDRLKKANRPGGSIVPARRRRRLDAIATARRVLELEMDR